MQNPGFRYFENAVGAFSNPATYAALGGAGYRFLSYVDDIPDTRFNSHVIDATPDYPVAYSIDWIDDAAPNAPGGNRGPVLLDDVATNNPNNRQLRLFPDERYNRRQHYGNTPTQADRRAFGAGPDQVVDHDPPLVVRYYEGDPSRGELPGFNQTDAQRRASGSDRSRMQLQPRSESNSQGGVLSQYSRRLREIFGLD